MWRAIFAALMCTASLWPCADRLAAQPTAPQSPAALPEAVHTQEREFVIPFAVENSGQQSTVELYVSVDRGQSWQRQAAAEPGATGFTFRAPHDGEYWFAVRLIDNRRPNEQAALLEPEMRVIVGQGRTAPKVVSQLSAALAVNEAGARWVNSTVFEIEYNDQARTATGPVELWYTGDGGATWHRYGIDIDRQSPLRVKVDGEGLYGFWLVLEAATGPRDVAPAPGDRPEAWVAVDTQPPTVRLTTAEIAHATAGDELVVRWEASDTRLANQPAMLEYSPRLTGPWLTLGRAAPDAGVCRCLVGDLSLPAPGMPIYARLTVRDAAGNSTTFTTQEPITLPAPVDPSRSVRATPSAARTSRWMQVLR